jgi:hypothetical protein
MDTTRNSRASGQFDQVDLERVGGVFHWRLGPKAHPTDEGDCIAEKNADGEYVVQVWHHDSKLEG